MSNAYLTYPPEGDSHGKPWVIPHTLLLGPGYLKGDLAKAGGKRLALEDGGATHQLVGEVTAHQGEDG